MLHPQVHLFKQSEPCLMIMKSWHGRREYSRLHFGLNTIALSGISRPRNLFSSSSESDADSDSSDVSDEELPTGCTVGSSTLALGELVCNSVDLFQTESISLTPAIGLDL